MVPEVPFLWMTHNNQHEAYFYAPSGAPVAHRQGHLSSLTVFVLDAENRVTDLVHPVAHRGVHVDYEPAEETGSVHPATAFTYNTVGERAGKPVQNVVYSYTEAAESSASVQVSSLLTEVTTGAGSASTDGIFPTGIRRTSRPSLLMLILAKIQTSGSLTLRGVC